ncbi:MAG: hypothetical protein N3B12_07085, partial [Armatimonadetes bacterium]|nr:hypothetical protein [Armatimonadota bacterium]
MLLFVLAVGAVLVLIVGEAVSAASVTVTVNFNTNLGTIKTEYGMNEVDRATYFAGITQYPNTQIIQNHRDLGTRRIRIFYRNDWTQDALDALIAAVIDAGAVPMVCFQYVPPGMSYSAWGDWCAAAVARYKARYDISDWMWEIINEPDITGYTSETYTSLFTIVEPKIHAVYPNAMVGGPGLSGLNVSWISALFASSSRDNIQFISWHRYGGWYPGPNWPPDSTILNQLPYYESDINNAYNALPSDKKNTKLILGEFNVNAWAGDVNGQWLTDPRIKTIFNAVYYAGVLKRVFRTSQGRQAACELHWEGTGDDTPSGSPGFGMWYSQVPTNRTPAYYAKKAIVASFPYGATLVSASVSGSSYVEAFACKYGTPTAHGIAIVNKTTATNNVRVILQNSSFTSGTWRIIDGANPTGYTVSVSGTTHDLTLNGYAVAVLETPPPQQVEITSGPTVIENLTTVTIQWTTNLPSYSKVRWGLTKTYGSVASDQTLLTQHSITLTGLTPYTNYHFCVESGGPGLITVRSPDRNFWSGRPTGVKINQAKNLPNGSQVYLWGKVVTCVQ